MIQVQGITKVFPGNTALDDLSFTVERGEVLGLLGPNGAGKTTCMRILTGFLSPSSGTILVDGRDVQHRWREVRKDLGYLPEGAPLYHEMRVTEYLDFRARLRGLRRRKPRQHEIARVTERCALEEARGRIIGHLSRGYRQRVGLADALLGDPSLLILDEPTAGLDPNQNREIRHLITSLHETHTIVLSTHILSEVEATCSRAVIIHRGRLVAQGTLAALGQAVEHHSLMVKVRGQEAEVRRVLGDIQGVTIAHAEQHEQVVRCHLRGEIGPEARERIVRILLEAGLPLQELREERPRLEEIFAKLTDANDSPPPLN